MRINNRSLSLRLCDAIYGNLWEPGWKGFCMAEALAGNSYRQMGSSAVKRTKQMGFRLGEIFSPKCLLNLAHLLTYALFLFCQQLSTFSAGNTEGRWKFCDIVLSTRKNIKRLSPPFALIWMPIGHLEPFQRQLKSSNGDMRGIKPSLHIRNGSTSLPRHHCPNHPNPISETQKKGTLSSLELMWVLIFNLFQVCFLAHPLPTPSPSSECLVSPFPSKFCSPTT